MGKSMFLLLDLFQLGLGLAIIMFFTTFLKGVIQSMKLMNLLKIDDAKLLAEQHSTVFTINLFSTTAYSATYMWQLVPSHIWSAEITTPLAYLWTRHSLRQLKTFTTDPKQKFIYLKKTKIPSEAISLIISKQDILKSIDNNP